MWAHAISTLRFAVRSPMAYGLLVAGGFVGWFGISLAILALDAHAVGQADLVGATAELAGALLVIWLLQRTLDDDAGSGFTAAADATGPGAAGRLLGRWLGCTAAGVTLSAAIRALVALSGGLPVLDSLCLVYTSIVPLGLLAAWGAVLGCRTRGGLMPVLAIGAWAAGHLPWGHPDLLPGPLGQALGAWLPGPAGAGDPATIVGRVGVVAALLLVAVGLVRPASLGDA